MFFKRRRDEQDGATATASGHGALERVAELESQGSLFEAIDLLTDANRAERDNELQLKLRELRHLAGIELRKSPTADPRHPDPAPSVPPLGEQSRVPEVTPAELSAETLRAAILERGCLLVRDLMPAEKAERIAREVDVAHEVRSRLAPGEVDPDGYYDELQPLPPYVVRERPFVEEGGGVLAADSPRLLFDMLESFEAAGLRGVIEEYLGEKPVISAQKCTLRKATPEVAGAWHQDGAFMGPVRSLNVWLSLSRCGDVAPSMDLVPRRLEEFAQAGGEGTYLDFQISQETAERLAGDAGIVRPIFDPGDALLFDDKFLHQTGSDPAMPNPRYAIESWFFGASAFPKGYVPIAF